MRELSSTTRTQSPSRHKFRCAVLAAMTAGDRCVGPSGVQGISSRASKNSVPSESAEGEWRCVLNGMGGLLIVASFIRSIRRPCAGILLCTARSSSATPTILVSTIPRQRGVSRDTYSSSAYCLPSHSYGTVSYKNRKEPPDHQLRFDYYKTVCLNK